MLIYMFFVIMSLRPPILTRNDTLFPYTTLFRARQVDLKKVIAYASVSHMSFVILVLFTTNIQGISGSIFLMLSHGIVSSCLFFCIGCVYDRSEEHTSELQSLMRNSYAVFCCNKHINNHI